MISLGTRVVELPAAEHTTPETKPECSIFGNPAPGAPAPEHTVVSSGPPVVFLAILPFVLIITQCLIVEGSKSWMATCPFGKEDPSARFCVMARMENEPILKWTDAIDGQL